MKGIYDKSATEGDINWYVEQTDCTEFTEMKISAENTKTHKKATENYRLEYAPVFGLDIVDYNNIEDLLDKIIGDLR